MGEYSLTAMILVSLSICPIIPKITDKVLAWFWQHQLWLKWGLASQTMVMVRRKMRFVDHSSHDTIY